MSTDLDTRILHERVAMLAGAVLVLTKMNKAQREEIARLTAENERMIRCDATREYRNMLDTLEKAAREGLIAVESVDPEMRALVNEMRGTAYDVTCYGTNGLTFGIAKGYTFVGAMEYVRKSLKHAHQYAVIRDNANATVARAIVQYAPMQPTFGPQVTTLSWTVGG